MAMKRVVLKRLKLTEAQVTKQCIDFLLAERWYCIRLNSGLLQRPGSTARLRVGEKGLPDYICTRGNEYFFLEFKASGGRLRTAQRDWIARAKADSLNVLVCSGLDELQEWLLGPWWYVPR